MRRVFPVLLGALAFLVLTTAGEVHAQTTTTTPATTTTAAPVPPSSTTSTSQKPATTTTVRSGATTTTVVTNGGRPIPPPPAGASQPLVADLLGTPVTLETTTTLYGFAPRDTPTIPSRTESASTISTQKTSPSGATLILATVAWLASLGGLLVYAEDRRASRWRHLAR